MAFQVKREHVQIPTSLKNSYVVPFAWLHYGIGEGFIEVTDPMFYDTIQGSIYSEWLFQLGVEHVVNTTTGVKNGDIWLHYETGSGVINWFPISDRFTLSDAPELHNEGYRPPLIKMLSLEGIRVLDPVEQREINRQLMFLLRGCGLRLKRSVWFLN